jgi:glutathione S-transferase
MNTLKVYGMSSSGNCFKVRLLLEQLQLPYDWVEIDTRSGITRQSDFLSRNPNGRVPTLEYAPGRYLAESNAILAYLAEDTPLWPPLRIERALVLQWMFFEQYSHEPYIAVARYICTMLPADHERRADLPRLRERGEAALAVMQQQLARGEFLVANRYSIADIALYAYTHVAADAGFDLGRYPAVLAWLERVRAQPRYIAMPSPPAPP